MRHSEAATTIAVIAGAGLWGLRLTPTVVVGTDVELECGGRVRLPRYTVVVTVRQLARVGATGPPVFRMLTRLEGPRTAQHGIRIVNFCRRRTNLFGHFFDSFGSKRLGTINVGLGRMK